MTDRQAKKLVLPILMEWKRYEPNETVDNEFGAVSEDSTFSLEWAPVRPGTIRLAFIPIDIIVGVIDDGNGCLLTHYGETVGSVNYLTGKVGMLPKFALVNYSARYIFDCGAIRPANTPPIHMTLTSTPITARKVKLYARTPTRRKTKRPLRN